MSEVSPLSKQRSRSQAPHGRIRYPKHLAYIAENECCVHGCHAAATVHHLRLPCTDAAAGRRSSDAWAVPLCPEHHQGPTGVHQRGDEGAWWEETAKIDGALVARTYWKESVLAGRVKAGQSGQEMP